MSDASPLPPGALVSASSSYSVRTQIGSRTGGGHVRLHDVGIVVAVIETPDNVLHESHDNFIVFHGAVGWVVPNCVNAAGDQNPPL